MSGRQYDILCIGTALVDSIIRGFDPTPVSASGYRAVSGSLNVGGEAVNESMAAAKLGMHVGILCSLGTDSAGELIVDELKRSGVDTSPVVRSAEQSTPVTTMFVRDDGSRQSITNSAHRYNFHPERYTDLFPQAHAVILGSLFRSPFDDPDIIHSVLRSAKAAGCITVADTKLPNFRVLGLDDLRDALPLIDCITPNEDEARYYTGKTDPDDMAEVFLSCGIRSVIIKLGGKGCLFRNASLRVSLPAHRIRAVDATGAGDNFVAGFTSELLRGSSPEEALRFANACGAVCTTAVGAATALRSREQILSFIAEQEKNAE